MNDFEKSEKLTVERKYFNISVIWIFYFRLVLRRLYYLKVPHEAVTGLSIIGGLAAAYCFYNGRLIAAAVLLHLKDVFDACDGALARMTGRGHLIGRYMDSLGDFVVLTAVVWAIALRQVNAGYEEYYLWGVATIFSIFIQCSFFNYYQLSYLKCHSIDSLSSKRDESQRDDLDTYGSRPLMLSIIKILRVFYAIIYGWQDKLVAAIDRGLFVASRVNKRQWYGSRRAMTLVSPLCFGTHIFVIIIFAIVGQPGYSLRFISIIMNIYLVLYLTWRRYLTR